MLTGEFTEYKGYIGSFNYDYEDEVYYGRVLKIQDLVIYEGENLDVLIDEFHDEVDKYVKFLRDIGDKNEV